MAGEPSCSDTLRRLMKREDGNECDAALTGMRWRVREAMGTDLEWIARQRHEVYARELGQLTTHPSGRYRDALDERNRYTVVERGEQRVGFISLTPPEAKPFSVHKYFSDDDLAFLGGGRWFEIRILTVSGQHRGGPAATLLMYAAYRWVQAHGGTHVVILGRDVLCGLYTSFGFRQSELTTRAGKVCYRLMQSDIGMIDDYVRKHESLFRRLESVVQWDLPFAFRSPAACFHGGRFFEAVGERFDDLSRRDSVINADVLDAWFPPAPGVLDTIREHLDWVLKTSPPTSCDGFLNVVAESRGVPVACLVPGAGSSDLIFRAFLRWLKPSSRVLLLDPTYGEYAHVLERVVRCRVDRMTLSEADGFRVSLEALERRMAEGFDLVVLVNPNSPTGQYLSAESLAQVLRRIPETTRVWVDETYVDYVGAGASLERFAVQTRNIFVCKSMSKVYALSGCRVAYLCGGAPAVEDLRSVTPPWVVGLGSQIAAVRALENRAYYENRYAETHRLRGGLVRELRAIGLSVLDGVANFVLCRLPEDVGSVADVVQRMADRGVYIRDVSKSGGALREGWIRIAVKSARENGRVTRELQLALSQGDGVVRESAHPLVGALG
jgi:histidinol-phosphate/aromatic aminotransferase/cobyric acid decarboxylase-like protein/GNAT superfamily N-acetyltransferase